jgi:hypothetical protein
MHTRRWTLADTACKLHAFHGSARDHLKGQQCLQEGWKKEGFGCTMDARLLVGILS